MNKCPKCGVFMSEVTKADVLIDICPQCEGIWLDRGELDKIIQRNKQVDNPPYRTEPRYDDDYKKDYAKDDYYYKDGHKYQKKKKFGFLDELFD